MDATVLELSAIDLSNCYIILIWNQFFDPHLRLLGRLRTPLNIAHIIASLFDIYINNIGQ
jgi:hypothetical protein